MTLSRSFTRHNLALVAPDRVVLTPTDHNTLRVPRRASEHATLRAALNCALTPVSEVPAVCVSVTPHPPSPVLFKASESQVGKLL